MKDWINKYKIDLIIIAVVLVCGGFIGAGIHGVLFPNKTIINVPVTDIYQKAIDTLIADKKRHIAYERVLEGDFKAEVKQAEEIIYRNKQKYVQIKNFTDSTRFKWADSLAKKHGFK